MPNLSIAGLSSVFYGEDTETLIVSWIVWTMNYILQQMMIRQKVAVSNLPIMMKWGWHVKGQTSKSQSKISGLTKIYYITVSMQKISSIHQFILETEPI